MKFSNLQTRDKFRFYGGALNMTYLFVGKRVQGTIPSTNNPENARLRSKTYPGIARAMAEQ